MLKKNLIEKIIDILNKNKDIISIDELLLEISEYKQLFYNYKLNENIKILEILKENKVRLKRALKVKLFNKEDTTSLKELAKLLNNENEETNNDRTIKYISNLVREWASNELQ